MHAKTLIAILFATSFMAIASSPAQASEVDDLPTQAFMSTLTRADVRADVLNGPTLQQRLLADWAHPLAAAPASSMSLTRAQVAAEAREALRLGVLDGHEYTLFATPQQLDSIRMAGQRAARMDVASR